MPVMQIRVMWVAVFQRLMDVRMGVRFVAVPWEIVRVLVVLVVDVAMVVFEQFVLMFVRVAFADVQPYADGHQSAGDPEREPGGFVQQQQGKRCANEWRSRKVRASARRA